MDASCPRAGTYRKTFPLPTGRAIHVQGNFLIISLQKFRGNEEKFSMWIFPCGIPGDISMLKFPLWFPQNFKMQFNDTGRVPVMLKYPSDDLMSFFGELE